MRRIDAIALEILQSRKVEAPTGIFGENLLGICHDGHAGTTAEDAKQQLVRTGCGRSLFKVNESGTKVQ